MSRTWPRPPPPRTAIVSGVSSSSTGSFSLGTIVNPGNFTYSLQTLGGSENLLLTAATPLTTAYFVGTSGAIFNAANNWAQDAANTMPTPLAPTSGTDVYMGVNNVPNPANLNMTLGVSASINSLTFTGSGTTAASSPITIGGAGTLSIAAAGGGVYGAGTGIVVQNGSANHAINANVALGQAQSWTVNGTSTLSVSGQISGTALTKAGSGTLVLSNGSTYTGATNITGGTLRLSSANISVPLTTNLAIQLDAANAASLGSPTNGATINSWNNSGAGSLAAGGNFAGSASYLSSDPSLNNKPAVAFNGGQLLTNGTNFANNVTVIYVGQLTGTQNQRLVSSVGNNWLLGYWGGHQDAAYFTTWVSPGAGSNDPAATTAPEIYAATIDASGNGSFYKNTTQIGTTHTGTAGPSGISLGGWDSGGPTELSAGYVGELLVYNGVLSQAQLQSVAAYLDAKWGFGMLPLTTPVTISGGDTFDLNGLGQTIGSLASSDPTTRRHAGGRHADHRQRQHVHELCRHDQRCGRREQRHRRLR